VTFAASGDQLADLTDANTTTFSAGDAPGLSTPRLGEPKGSLVISDADNVPNNTFSVGISMSSAGTFVTNAGANLTHIFTPTPTYWIAAGINVKVGTVLDYTAVTRHKQVIFPSHTYALTYSLNQSNQWELVP
jgi:hypothetical protein